MAKRAFITLFISLAILSGLGFLKFRQIQTSVKASTFQPPPESVTTVVVSQEHWPSTLSVVGTAAAVHGVTVSADLPGKVERIAFESGRPVQQGDVLVDLDTRQERAQLAAAEAARDLAHINYDRSKALVDQGVLAKSEFDKVEAERRGADAAVGEIRATIERKTIRAPFGGVLGIRQVNLGQYLAAGDPVVPLQSIDPIYVNFGVPQQNVAQIHLGQSVQVLARDLGGAVFAGRVTAVNSVVDEATRNIQIQATLSNPGGRLRPGMYVEVVAGVGADRSVIPLPASAISYAPFGDSVYVVDNVTGPKGETYRGVRQQFVKLEGARGDQVGVVSGLKPGDEVVTSGAFKLHPGAAVQVNNSIQPANSVSPKPEDN